MRIIIGDISCVSPGSKKPIVLNDSRVVAPWLPFERWTTSKRPSVVMAEKLRQSQLTYWGWPESLAEAREYLGRQYAAGIVLSHEEPRSPFPFGLTWLKIHPSHDAMRAAGQWVGGSSANRLEYYYAAGYRWYIGNRWHQDGGKFLNSTYHAAQESGSMIKVFVLEKEWLSELGDDVLLDVADRDG